MIAYQKGQLDQAINLVHTLQGRWLVGWAHILEGKEEPALLAAGYFRGMQQPA